ARVLAHRAGPARAAGTARLPDVDPRRRRRAGCRGRSHRAAAAGPAGLPQGAPAPLRGPAPVGAAQPGREGLTGPPRPARTGAFLAVLRNRAVAAAPRPPC